ncbi:unnamed protein product [Parascedosporium putredinis]|uniref:Cytochrome b561 domain-containing protein n=1 Tax=Parascedosporium putredinis TaxID=1442378 RepID=A0A9P1H5C4_9PEZI|nr:unnamed protein product [Parascedosporium putredinis]CAI7997799.1 unnamed protein product [Parascedosporium putredinis]
MKSLKSYLASASLLFASTVSAQFRYCPIDREFCMSVAVPQVSAQSGSGNLYFQMEALDTYTWVAVGTGSFMSGSNIFVLYQDGNGNVTVSTRSGTGAACPLPERHPDRGPCRLRRLGRRHARQRPVPQLRVVEGRLHGPVLHLLALDRCLEARKPLNTADTNAAIAQHADFDQVRIDLTQAAVTLDVNPFLTGGTTGGTGNNNGNTGNTGGNTGTGTGNNGNNVGGGGNLTGGNSGAGSGNRTVNLVRVHGILMALAFVVLYPIGALLIPLVGKWYIHAGCQSVAFLVMWAGFGTGYMRANAGGILFKQTHTILGAIVTFAMVLQPALGILHHRYYMKHKARAAVSYVHIWYGRVLLLVGVVNGGIGLRMAGSPSPFVIAYAVLAAVIGAAYVASTLVGSMRKSREFRRSSPERLLLPNYSTSGGAGGNYNESNYNGNYPRREDIPVQFQFERRGPRRPRRLSWRL